VTKKSEVKETAEEVMTADGHANNKKQNNLKNTTKETLEFNQWHQMLGSGRTAGMKPQKKSLNIIIHIYLRRRPPQQKRGLESAPHR